MEISPQEKIKLADFREQYNSILGNISVANDTLEKINNDVSKANETIKRLNEKSIDIQKKNNDFVGAIQVKENELNNRENSIFKYEEILTQKENKITNLSIEINKIIKDKLENLDILLIEKKLKEKELEKTIAIEKEEFNKIKAKNIALRLDNEFLSNTRHSLEQEIEKNKIEIEEKQKDKKQAISFLEKQFIEIEKKVNEEKNKVNMPQLLLNEREQTVATREKNFLIMKNRLKKYLTESGLSSDIKL